MAQRKAQTGKLEISAQVAQIVESAAAVAAIGLAGWWFVEQRENYPRADLAQAVEVVPVEPGVVAIEANVSIKNTGKKLIKLHRARVRLQEVSGKPFDYKSLAQRDGSSYWQAIRPKQTPDRRQFHSAELRWPVLKIFDGDIDYHIEPGETDNMVVTFLVPCHSKLGAEQSELRNLRVATDVFKPNADEGKEFAWKARTFVNVTEECRT
jgi:hypothetical protein